MGVQGFSYFSYFNKKYRMWILIRTASLMQFYQIPTIYVLSSNKKITFIHLTIAILKPYRSQNIKLVHNVYTVTVFDDTLYNLEDHETVCSSVQEP